jgi:hypothetical protein
VLDVPAVEEGRRTQSSGGWTSRTLDNWSKTRPYLQVEGGVLDNPAMAYATLRRDSR